MPRPRAALAVLVVLAAPAAASATRPPAASAAPLWPSMRHDVRNTGASDVRPRVDRRARPWAFHTARGIFSTPVLDAAGDVYVGSADRSFVALSPRGRLRWRIRTGGLIDAAAVLGPGPVVTFGSGDEVLRRVRTRRPPRELWRALPTLPPAPGQLVRWWEGNPQLAPDGTTYVGNTGGGAYALDPTGRPRWAHQRGNSVWTTPAVGRDGTTYWGSLDLATFALRPDGRERWSTAAGGYVVASPALSADGRTLYTASFDGSISALDAATGARRWRVTTPSHVYASPALREDPAGRLRGVAFASTDGTIRMLRPGGRERWRYDTGEPVRSSPVLGRVPGAPAGSPRRIVYAGSGDGRLYALDADTGRRRWSYDTTPRRGEGRERNDLNASPALGRTGVVIAGEHGDVVGVPYDWCLRHRRATRCDVRPGEPLPRDARRLVGVTPGGQLEDRGLSRRALPATAALPLHLVVRRRGRTLLTGLRSPQATLRLLTETPAAPPGAQATVRPPVSVRLQPSADGRDLVVVPRNALGAGRRYALRVTGTVDGAAFAQTLRLRTAPARPGPPRLGAFELTRLAVPEPAFLASVNQIGFDQTELLVGPVAGDGHAVTLWAIGATRGADGVLRPDPAAATAFALRASLRGDRLVATARRARVRFSFGDVPTRRLELRALLRPGLRERGAPSLVTETACGGVPVYGPLLRAIQLCNDEDVLVTSGTAATRPYAGAGTRAPVGLQATGPDVRRPTATAAGAVTARLTGPPVTAARHVVAILLTDATAGVPVDLDLGALTTVATDAGGRVTGVALRLPPGTRLPARVAAHVLVDLAPVPRAAR